MAMSADIIKLNVGGTRMETFKSTLTQLPFFESLLTRWSTSKSTDQTELFIDYDPVLFTQLLNKLRNAHHEFPLMNGIDAMCQYFGYVNKDNYKIANVLREDTNDYQHTYIVNTFVDKLFGICFYLDLDKFIGVKRLDVTSENNHDIINVGQLGLLHVCEEVSRNIWDLNKVYLDKLQNYRMLTINIYFTQEATTTRRSAVYIKKLINTSEQSNKHTTKSETKKSINTSTQSNKNKTNSEAKKSISPNTNTIKISDN